MKTKKLLITLIAIAGITCNTLAQTKKGSFILSGSTAIDLSYVSVDLPHDAGGDSSFNLNITPAAGYFVIDDLAIGLQASFAYIDSDASDKSTQFTMMPTVQYYLPVGSVLRPFIQVGAGYAHVSQSVLNTNNTSSRESFRGFTWAAAAGASYFVKKNISLDFGVQYAAVNTSYSGNTSIKLKTKGVGATLGISLYL